MKVRFSKEYLSHIIFFICLLNCLIAFLFIFSSFNSIIKQLLRVFMKLYKTQPLNPRFIKCFKRKKIYRRRIMVWVTTPRPNLSPRIKKKKMFFFLLKEKKILNNALDVDLVFVFLYTRGLVFLLFEDDDLSRPCKILSKNHVYAGLK